MTRTRNSYRDLESWWWRRHRLPWMSSRRHYRSGRFPSPCCIRHRSGNSCSETWSWRTLKQTCFPQLSSSERSPLSKSPHRRPTIGLYTSAIEKRNTLNEHRRTKDARHNVCAIEEETRTITVSTRLTHKKHIQVFLRGRWQLLRGLRIKERAITYILIGNGSLKAANLPFCISSACNDLPYQWAVNKHTFSVYSLISFEFKTWARLRK